MNMRKALPLFVIATIIMTLIPSMLVSAAVVNTLSVSFGPVGTKVTVSGTIETYNGNYKIEIDANGDGDFLDAGEALAGVATTVTASGYAYAKEVTIPDCRGGARTIRVTDLGTGVGANALFTVTTSYKLTLTTPDDGYQVEGGPVTVTATLKGVDVVTLGVGKLDLQFRFKDPAGNVIAALTAPYTDLAETVLGFGTFTQAHVIAGNNVNLVTNGLYTALLDWDDDAGFTETARQGVASVTFTIRPTDKLNYDRTQQVFWKVQLGAGITYDYYDLVDPLGALTHVDETNIGPAGFAAGALPATTKTTTLGTWTLKLYDTTATLIKSVPFTVNPATISPVIVVFSDTSTLADGALGDLLVQADNVAVKRMHKITIDMTVKYPDLTDALPADITAGFDVKVYYNTTLFKTLHLDPLTAWIAGAPNVWRTSWVISKDAPLGKNWTFNVTASGIADANGNAGPKKDYGTADVNSDGANDHRIKVAAGTIFVNAPVLNYPGVGALMQRTLEAKATIDIRYADNSRVTGTDMSKFNVTGTDSAAKSTVIYMAAADYNADVGLWVAKWETPYNAALGAATFKVLANNFKDLYGNKGPGADTAASGAFNVDVATITISNVATNAASYETDNQVIITFDATYPNGDAVTKRTDLSPTVTREYPVVTIYDSAGTAVATLRAGYVSGKWTASWIVAAGSLSGKYNATIDAFSATVGAEKGFADSADAAVLAKCNTGPTVKKYVNFDVTRVSMTDVMAASEAAEAAAVLAQTKADAAKTAADTAGTKADAAKTAADAAKTAATAAQTAATAAQTAATGAQTTAQSAVTAATDAKTAALAAQTAATAAGTKADAATAAANAAKTSADAAAAAANSLTTMVYVAIAASVVAALAAIFAVMQINKKIA
jgi:hypothetical protein